MILLNSEYLRRKILALVGVLARQQYVIKEQI